MTRAEVRVVQRRGHEPPEAGEGQELDRPPEPPGGTHPADAWILDF